MKHRSILFVINGQTPDDAVRQAADAAAQSDSRLTCLMLGEAPPLPVFGYGVAAYGGIGIPDTWGTAVSEAQAGLEARGKAVEAVLAGAAWPGAVQTALCAVADIKHVVGQQARVSDEAHLAPELCQNRDTLREAAAGVLFHSPIGLRLNGPVCAAPKRVFLAWDGSEAAASAAHVALPYLRDAREVVVACVDPQVGSSQDRHEPGADVAGWLSHHGCKVTVAQYPSGGMEVGELLQNRAREFGADLVVMGAYGHARMVQTVLGGTTRTMMEQTDLPVLFAH